MIGRAVAKLLDIASAETGGGAPDVAALPPELGELLTSRDGFFAFEAALEVFPSSKGGDAYSVGEWNSQHLWKQSYGRLTPQGICFAQDIFGVQFLFGNEGVRTFDPETGESTTIANSLEAWADRILVDYDLLTGFSIAHQWQQKNGRLAFRTRLVPITPFVLGGKFELGNLVALDSVSGMKHRGELALQLEGLPDGAQVRYKIV